MIGALVEWSPGRRNSPGWVIEESGCHTWVGSRNKGGYGTVRVDKKTRDVHRLRYEREVGPIPDGTELDHFFCDDRGCCNPLHCRPVGSRENTLRGNGPTAANAAKTHCPAGHPLSGGNLLPSALRRGERVCRTCRNERKRKRRKERCP